MTREKTISNLIQKVVEHYHSAENVRRKELWTTDDASAIRGETQWHGIPKHDTLNGNPIPITVECQDNIWTDILGFNFVQYFEDPLYYLEYLLKIKIEKFTRLPDDTPINLNIPIWFGVIWEAGLLGQKYYFPKDDYPWLDKDGIVDYTTNFSIDLDFDSHPLIKKAIYFYDKIKELAGPEFKVIFPTWFRGPQGVALYLRGFNNFLIDLYENPDWCHRLLRYITDAEKAYVTWRSRYLDEPILKGDLFNDDLPLIGAEHYKEFIFPYEQELCDFFGGVYYWHSCGNPTHLIRELTNLSPVSLIDFGVAMEDKLEALQVIGNEQPVELRVLASKYIQIENESLTRQYITQIINQCKQLGLKKYVLRSSGMSILLGPETDLKKLKRWIEITRDASS